MIISNLLAAWGSISLCHLLIIPWLALYFAYILFVFGLLLYMVVLLYHIWFKIVIFLIVSPILIIAIIFWLTLLELFFSIRVDSKKAKSRLAKKWTPRPIKNVNFAPPHPNLPYHQGRFPKRQAPPFVRRHQYKSNQKNKSNYKKHKSQRKEGLHKSVHVQATAPCEDGRPAEEYQDQGHSQDHDHGHEHDHSHEHDHDQQNHEAAGQEEVDVSTLPLPVLGVPRQVRPGQATDNKIGFIN